MNFALPLKNSFLAKMPAKKANPKQMCTVHVPELRTYTVEVMRRQMAPAVSRTFFSPREFSRSFSSLETPTTSVHFVTTRAVDRKCEPQCK